MKEEKERPTNMANKEPYYVNASGAYQSALIKGRCWMK